MKVTHRLNLKMWAKRTIYQIPLAEADTFSRLQASWVAYRFATGPSRGKKAMTIRTLPDSDHSAKAGLVARASGFSLHAGVATKAEERLKLERICRYIARPALAEGRLSLTHRGKVINKLKTPWADGTTAIKMTQMELMERLVALVPRPRVHLTRFHGVLAPHSKFRRQIVLQPLTLQPPTPQLASNANTDATEALTKSESSASQPASQRMSWARLLKRVFGIDIRRCPKSGKPSIRIIAAIEDLQVIKTILNHLGFPRSAPPLAPARGPPDPDQGEFFEPLDPPLPQYWD